jgi:polyisoprenoid-binding protein YceI
VSDLRERFSLSVPTSEKENIEMSTVESTSKELLSSGHWTVDPAHSTIEFRVKRMVIETVKGRFREFQGAIAPGTEPTVSGVINVASLDTLHTDRDEHLRSPDFFDVERFPEITFESGELTFDEDDSYFAVHGTLTIKGVARPITLDGEFRGTGLAPDGSEKIVLALRGQFERSDFGLVWNRMLETGGLLVGNIVDFDLDISAVRAD